jgi:hypothetical protein
MCPIWKGEQKVNRFLLALLIIVATNGLLLVPSARSQSYSTNGQEKLAQTGFNFLGVSSDARAGAMGDAVTSLQSYVGALSHNPSTMADIQSPVAVDFSMNSWIADIKYISLDAVIAPLSGRYGVIGLTLQSIDYGDVEGTMVWPNSQGYVDTQVMTPSALAVGIAYADMISTQFGVGGQIQFAYQSLGQSVVQGLNNTLTTKQNVANALVYSFGTIYRPGIKSLAFGMSIRNFSKDVTYEQESFSLPLMFTFGVSANVLDFAELGGPKQSFIISCDLSHPTAHPEQLKIGGEYDFMNIIALRAGYITGDSEDGITYGVGFSSSGLGISATNISVDYSYTPFGVFNSVQRFTVSFSL